MLKSLQEIVRDAEDNIKSGTVHLSDYVDWSFRETINRIDAYSNSRHISGDTDSLGRVKPFFNIVSAATNIWYRATDLDRKDIKFVPDSQKAVPLALVANVILQNWMNSNRFGQFLNSWGRTLAKYGSAVVKFVEKDGELIPSVIPWNRIICDTVDFEALPRIEKFYKTPEQLKKLPYDQKQVEGLLSAQTTRKTIGGDSKDKQDKFIELYEIHGELDSRYLETDPDWTLPAKYVQQMHVVSFALTDDQYLDYTLFSGKEAKDPYMITHLIEEDGRTLAIGAVEYLFDAQWMQNHTVKNMKDTLDIISKLIMQTADPRYVGRNILTGIETGDIFVHAPDMPLTRVANDKPDISALQSFGMMWQNMSRELSSTPDALRGNTLPSGTPYSLGQYLGSQASSLFEIMTENKGLALEDMIKVFIIPNIKKKLKNKDEIVGILDDAGISEIDAMYIPKEAVERYNAQSDFQVLSGQPVQPFNPMMAEQQVKQEMGAQGNKRFFTPDKMGKKTWDAVFSDFQWENVRVQITGEQKDKQAALQTLTTVLQTLATNPAILSDENARLAFNAILRETGELSPIQFRPPTQPINPQLTSGGSSPAPLPTQ